MLDDLRNQVVSTNMQIRQRYKAMYQATQNTMSDHIIVDPDRDQKKMDFLKKELYMKHECRNVLAELNEC